MTERGRAGPAARPRELRPSLAGAQRRYALAVVALAGALGLTIAVPPRPLLVWNVSASAPVGLYAIGGRGAIAPGTMVLARGPAPWRQLAGERRYIPVNVPLVKRVAAVSGDTVCAVEMRILVNGRRVAERRARDGQGRPMPRWQGCVTLRDGALFLLMDDPASFDGRYFGPTGQGDILGKAHLLWRR
jgi:conjugative transfer signal peptidase TraF